jgi:hypothetical protein
MSIRFERPQGLDPFGELGRGFAQAISMRHGVVHLAARRRPPAVGRSS